MDPGASRRSGAQDTERAAADDLLIAEADQIAGGWRFVTVEGIIVDTARELELYEQVLEIFDQVAGSRPARHSATPTRLTLAVWGPDAQERADELIRRVRALNPQRLWGGFQWEIRDSAR
ncbi:hypothetical protein [Allonocardiopsis opalescens]|uniref:Uncharacterized protein n=1 Tax=Allonocardiopsis opalescens TaxID=1144618 RepID=A0A2T0QB37_9ACTN|nr:hypothetical protein [Allonocardiopsis opalescens]PRY01031.1 hypothetical protein CLV72_102667 [Allonocardiopsis opalescens]